VKRLALAGIACALLFPAAAWADAGEDEFETGRKAYYRKDYKGAEEHFNRALSMGNRNPKVWLFAGHTFLATGQFARALKCYETITTKFKDTDEAKLAKDSAAIAKMQLDNAAAAAPAAPAEGKPPATAKTPPAAKPAAAPAEAPKGSSMRIVVVPPKFGHPAVSRESIKAIHDAVASLPPHLRKILDDGNASINIAPNLIDKWPDSIADLEEKEEKEEPTLAEVPGRIYGRDMYLYERPKVRGSTNLGNSRPPSEIRHQVYNQCFQVIDSIEGITTDPALIASYTAEKQAVPESQQDKLATFLKEDEWGRRETCNELVADVLGQGGAEWKDDLNRCFPKTRRWLKAKLRVQ